MGLDYRDVSLIILYLIVIGISTVVKKVKNQHVLNGRTDFLLKIIELLRFLNGT